MWGANPHSHYKFKRKEKHTMSKNDAPTLEDVCDEMIEYYQDVLRNVAETTADLLVEAASSAIDSFYEDYYHKNNPRYPEEYVRMFRNFGYHGNVVTNRVYEGVTYRKYIRYNSDKTRCEAGVELTSENMWQDYDDSADDVFWDVYNGFHGPRFYSHVSPMRQSPLDIIEETHQAILKDKRYIDRIMEDTKYKNRNKYKYIFK